MEITLKHAIQYDIKAEAQIDDVIKSLIANERLLRDTTSLISTVVPGLTLEVRRISVVELSQTSPLKEIFVLGLFLAYQEELEKEVPQLIQQLTGVKIPESCDTLITVILLIIVIYGVDKAFEALFPGKDKKDLEKTKDGLLTRAAKMLGTTKDIILGGLAKLFSGRKERHTLIAAQRIFAPTRGQAGAIRLPGGDVLIPKATVVLAQSVGGFVPDDLALETPEMVSEFHNNVAIILHAMDRDRKRSGWAGHIPDLFDDRIPMDLEKSISPEMLWGKSEIRGDVLLKKTENEKGELVPKEFLLLRTYLK